MPIAIRYIGLLAQAQQMARTAAIEQGVKFVGDVVGVFPEAKDLVDIDKAVTEYCDSLGADIVRSPEKVAQIRAQMQKAMQAQQQQAAMAQLAQTGKTMSDTPVGGGASLLDHVLGTQGQVGQQ
jgi:acyl-CoA reductase-like NAD-dependent aldehyde dehydrogenase